MDILTPITHVPAPPPRPADAHKGTFGTVIVVGGTPTMVGAPAICASAALRCGVGLVKIATSAPVLFHALILEPGATGIIFDPNDTGEARNELHRADPKSRAVLAVGPGMGTSDEAAKLLAHFLKGSRTFVLDADAINILADTAKPRHLPGPPAVMTPHEGEFLRLHRILGTTPINFEDPAQKAIEAAALARIHQCVMVLKGHHTIVTDGTRLYTNTTGNVALATAGSGDALTGCIAALIAQGLRPFDAAVLGVYIHGLAADLWAQHHGNRGLTARELTSLFPQAFHTLENTPPSNTEPAPPHAV